MVIEWKKGKEGGGQEKVIKPEESIKECKTGEKELKGDREKRAKKGGRRRGKRNRRNGKNVMKKQERDRRKVEKKNIPNVCLSRKQFRESS